MFYVAVEPNNLIEFRVFYNFNFLRAITIFSIIITLLENKTLEIVAELKT